MVVNLKKVLESQRILLERIDTDKVNKKIVYNMYRRHIHRTHLLQSKWINIASWGPQKDGVNVPSKYMTKDRILK